MNFITLKELKKMVPVASEFKRVPGLKKILEDGIEVILRKQMENHAEVVVYKNGYVSYHAHERYTVFALHNCTHYYYESQGNEHQTISHPREILLALNVHSAHLTGKYAAEIWGRNGLGQNGKTQITADTLRWSKETCSTAGMYCYFQ